MTWLALNEAQNKAITELINTGSERIIAVVGGALFDSSLRSALESRMAPDKDKHRLLFKDTGPLSGQNKVTLAGLLYMFDDQTTKAMDPVYTIRNLFAHNLDMSFDSKDQRMLEATTKLTLHEVHEYYPHPLSSGKPTEYKIEPVEDNKTRFIVNLKILLIFVYKDSDKHLPQSNIPVDVYAATIGAQPQKLFLRRNPRLQTTAPFLKSPTLRRRSSRG
jgi:hypothetical protein